MIDLHMLKKEDIGRKVAYQRGDDWAEEGELTSWNERYVFVKFKGAGGEACEPGDVSFVVSPLPKDSMDLLPCPFCGEVAVEDETEQGDGQVRYEVKCSLCNASQYSYTSLRRAGIGWNARFETNSVNTDKTA